MYIGKLGDGLRPDDGICYAKKYRQLYWIEYAMGHGKSIEISMNEGKVLFVTDEEFHRKSKT
jgi:hypothetical protein